MILINGDLSENFDLLLEGELFNGSASYLTQILIDTGFTGFREEAPILIPDDICKTLDLVKSIETIDLLGFSEGGPIKCHTATLGIRVNENNVSRFKLYDVMAIILPRRYGSEILVGSDFLNLRLGCKRIIIDYERYYFRIVV